MPKQKKTPAPQADDGFDSLVIRIEELRKSQGETKRSLAVVESSLAVLKKRLVEVPLPQQAVFDAAEKAVVTAQVRYDAAIKRIPEAKRLADAIEKRWIAAQNLDDALKKKNRLIVP